MAKQLRQSTYPRRGEVWLVNFDPTIGSEIQKTRPALIIQNDASNLGNRRPLSDSRFQPYRKYPGSSRKCSASRAIVFLLNALCPPRIIDTIDWLPPRMDRS